MTQRPQVPSGYLAQGRHAVTAPVTMGATGMSPWYDAPEYASYNKVPAYYPINTILGGQANNTVRGTVQLRPEPFLLQRITYATTADIYTDGQASGGIGLIGLTPYSQHARSVELTWGDEFTQFMGRQPALVAAIFGDSWGYLDLPAPIFFQGSQQLQVDLRRLFWPWGPATIQEGAPIEIDPIDTQWDFMFEGVALLPGNVNQSGSE